MCFPTVGCWFTVAKFYKIVASYNNIVACGNHSACSMNFKTNPFALYYVCVYAPGTSMWFMELAKMNG
jgi:hypothetical protein